MAQTASREGNVLRTPSFGPAKTEVRPVEIMYSMVGRQVHGGTLKAGQGVLAAGCPLKKDSSTNLLVVDNPGSASTRGFLLMGVDTGSSNTDPGHTCNIVTAGAVKCSVIKAANGPADFHANGIAGLNGRVDAAADNGNGVFYF